MDGTHWQAKNALSSEGILQIRANRNEQTYYILVERDAIGARACISERVHDPEQIHRANATKNSGH